MDDKQEQSELAAERAEENRRRSGRDVPPRPSSQVAARAYVASKLPWNVGLLSDGDLRRALHQIERDLAVAGEENDWVRKWLIEKSGMIRGG